MNCNRVNPMTSVKEFPFVKLNYKDEFARIQLVSTWNTLADKIKEKFNISKNCYITLTCNDINQETVSIQNDQDFKKNWNLLNSIPLKKLYVNIRDVMILPVDSEEENDLRIPTEPNNALSLERMSGVTVKRKNFNDDNANTSPLPTVKNKTLENEPRKFIFNEKKIESKEIMILLDEIFAIPEVEQKVKERVQQMQNDLLSNGFQEMNTFIVQPEIQYSEYLSTKLTELMSEASEKLNAEKMSQKRKLEDDREKEKIEIPNSPYQKLENNTCMSEEQKELSFDPDNSSESWDELLEVSATKIKIRDVMIQIPHKALERAVDPIKESLTHKDLSDKYGIKLVLKHENGKTKLVSVPQAAKPSNVKAPPQFEESCYVGGPVPQMSQYQSQYL